MDLISRQDVIDELHEQFKEGFDEGRWWDSPTVLQVITDLPSAEPKKENEKCPNKLPCGWCRTFGSPCFEKEEA